MAEDAERVQREWADGSIIDTNHEFTRITLNIVRRTLFGAELINETGELHNAVATTQLVGPVYSGNEGAG